MKIAFFGDRHVSAKSPRYDHALACWDFAIEDAIAQGTSMFTGLGDVCEGQPTGQEYVELFRRYQRMTFEAPAYEAQGNHEARHALAPLPFAARVEIASERVVCRDIGACVLLVIGYPHRGREPFADCVGETILESHRLAAEKIARSVATARSLYPGKPLIVAGHWTVEGVTIGGSDYELHASHETVVPVSALGAADLVITGHVHRAQEIPPNIVVAGALYRTSFGERDYTPSYVLVTVAEGRVTWERRPVPARMLYELDLTWPLNERDQSRLSALEEYATGAEVKLVVTISEDQARTFDPTVFAPLQAAAAWSKVERRIQPVQRTRAPGLTAATSLAAQVHTWAETTGQIVEPERAVRLATKVGELEPA